MLFNSFLFLGFLAVFLPIYFVLSGRIRAQNAWLLLGSYFFYGNWDVRFLLLLMLSTVVDFGIALALGKATVERRRKGLLLASVVLNLGILGFFKYFNFFESNLIALFEKFGITLGRFEVKVMLPVGVSFYTFQSLGYIIDVYRRRLPPVANLGEYAVFVSFFPALMAGPIERAGHLIPQIRGPRSISAAQVNAGVYLILWGYFKKVVIADNVATLTNQIFNHYRDYQGLDLVIGALAFTLQIYGDFSGYSDIGRGVAKIMGFDLLINFRLPYVAASPSEFWQRWHISLSSWLRDYLYISLGGNRRGELRTLRNLLLTMLLGGLWHGAAWNYVLWGAFHGAILVVYRLGERALPPVPWSLRRILGVPVMFCLTVIVWILFRAESFDQIVYFFQNLGFASSTSSADFMKQLGYYAVPVVLFEALQHKKGDLLAVAKLPLAIRVANYTLLLAVIALFAVHEQTEFIYFQF